MLNAKKSKVQTYKSKPLTSLFLGEEKRKSIFELMKNIKDKFKSYDKNDVKRYRLVNLSNDMWNSMQNEFYMTANICSNTVWRWEDELSNFDKTGYLLYEVQRTELTEWSELLKGWFDRQWAVEVLKLIKDFNLDNQEKELVTYFQNDFKRARNDKEFRSALLKWHDLIHWSPWKMELLKGTFPQPVPSHWDNEFSAEIDEDVKYTYMED